MNNREPITVRTWGFPQVPLGWPEDLVFVQIEELPIPESVLVYGPKAWDFTLIVEGDQAAVLYQTDTKGEVSSDICIGYFDYVVGEGEWDSIRLLFSCPLRFEALYAASTIPTSQLGAVASALVKGTLDRNQLNDHEYFDHLKTCKICSYAMLVEIRSLLKHWELFECPPLELMVANIRVGPDPYVDAHLSICPHCRDVVQVLTKGLAMHERK